MVGQLPRVAEAKIGTQRCANGVGICQVAQAGIGGCTDDL